MSTLAQFFESGGQKGQKGHFRNLVMLARMDGEIDEQENVLLKRTARRLSLTEAQVQEILDHEEDYPMIPPHNREERFERFIRFIQMAMVDGEVSPEQRKLVLKYGVKLGMDEDKVEGRYESVVTMWLNGMDAYEILDVLIG